MTIRIELGAQLANHRQVILLPNKTAGDAPQDYLCTLRNTGADTITVTQFGRTSGGGRNPGWTIQENPLGTNVAFDLAPQATRTINMRVMPLSSPNALDTGIWTGVCYVRWRVGAGAERLDNIFFTGIVKDTSLPDMRLTKDELLSEHLVFHIPTGSAGGVNWGIRPDILAKGYTKYFEDEIIPVITWAGLSPGKRIKVFIDRVTGNSQASNNNNDVPFDGIIDLLEDTPDSDRAVARTTLLEGLAYLGTLDCDVMIYNGTLRADGDFIDLATDGDIVGLMDRLNRSIEPFMKLPNLHSMIFDTPFGDYAATDPRNLLYECIRRVCQARGVNVCAEPRGTAARDLMRPADGVGLCTSYGFGQLSNPAFNLDPAANQPPPWPPGFPPRRGDASVDGLEFFEWPEGVFAEHILGVVAANRVRSRVLGRPDSKPKRTVFIPWSFSKASGSRPMSAQALTDIVNGYIGVVTGDATQTVMDGPVSILP